MGNIDYLKAIDRRISRRTYTKTPIAADKVIYLKKRISELNDEIGLNFDWVENGYAAFSSFKSYGVFKNVNSVIVMKGSVNTAHLNERVGYFGQLLLLEATLLDLGTCWVVGTYDKNGRLFSTDGGEKIVSLVTVGNVPHEMTTKEKIIYRLIHRSSRTAEEFYTADRRVPDWFLSGIAAVQRAPSALNRQRIRFNYAEGMATASVTEGFPTDLIDLGIAKLHFELGAGGKFAFGNCAAFSKLNKEVQVLT